MKNLILTLVLTSIFGSLLGQKTPQRLKEYNLEKTLAIQGYDPVAYFVQNKAIEGLSSLSTTYLGVEYRFSSSENKALFLKNPSKYEPQYGGWCAYALGAKNNKVSINPETFKIIDGKLFLFYNAFFNNTLKSWNKDEQNLKIKADKAWENIVN